MPMFVCFVCVMRLQPYLSGPERPGYIEHQKDYKKMRDGSQLHRASMGPAWQVTNAHLLEEFMHQKPWCRQLSCAIFLQR